MGTYLILKEKAAQWNADCKIQQLLGDNDNLDNSMASFFGKYTANKAQALKAHTFDRAAIARRGLKYERLDQLTVELLLGMR
jgi:xylose isomerase